MLCFKYALFKILVFLKRPRVIYTFYSFEICTESTVVFSNRVYNIKCNFHMFTLKL